MSGIAGIYDLNTNENSVQKLLLTMKHRGPDRQMVQQGKNFTFLQTDHLRTYDKREPPIVLEWEGERYSIIFDGAIFNKLEICRMMKAEGHRFETHSDAELILQGYVYWKEKMLQYVNGVFALAIIHEREGKIFLARDRMGVRPLFYKLHQGGLVFASEMKTILAYPGIRAVLDAQGAGELLLLGPGRTPGSGVFKDIYEIKPGEFGIYQGGNLRLHTYWKLKDRVHTHTFDETVDYVRFLVKDAIRSQVPENIKTGTMLSGGLDSSVISAICAHDYDAYGLKLDTFSLDYNNNEKYFESSYFQPNMDSDYIRIMLSELDSIHHWTVLSTEELLEEILPATFARDLPGMADIDASLLAFSRQIKSHVDVVISGECADEIFGGYPWYSNPQMREYDGFPWARSTTIRQNLLQEWLIREIEPVDFIHERYLQTIQTADILPENEPKERRIKELVNLNLYWFMQTLLDRGDRMGAAAGLEIRAPFCDYRIVEYLYGVPWDYKAYRGLEKGLLRKSMEGLLPQHVLYRKKSPFPKTYDPQYLQIATTLFEALLQKPNSPLFHFVSRKGLEELLHGDFSWPWYGQLMLKPQTMMYMYQINSWLNHYSVTIV